MASGNAHEDGQLLDLTAVEQLRTAVGDEAFGAIVELYLDESSTLLEGLDEALTSGDAGAVAARSHSLHSSSATIGAAVLARACKDLERSARAGLVGDVGELAAAVRALHGRSVDALQEERGGASSGQ
jgi:HPt (histidine-containing phosphotransfer) domain-containing protein